MDRYELSVEIAKFFHDSNSPRDDWKYIANRLIECRRVYFPREDVKVQNLVSVLSNGVIF